MRAGLGQHRKKDTPQGGKGARRALRLASNQGDMLMNSSRAAAAVLSDNAAAGTPGAAARQTATIAQQLAVFIHDTNFRNLPAETVAQAKSRLLDALATAVAARDLPVPGVARRFVQANRGPATVFGHNERVTAVDAAFVNATLVNGCTHDDFLEKSHPGAVTIPAAIAVAEERGGGGQALLASIVVGYDITARAYLGGPGMLPKFRGSGVAGAVGAAAAAGKMLGLGVDELANALGCSTMFASGFGEGFRSGTMDVKLNVGWACRSGVSAALLSKAGATASPLAFEGESGFFRAFAGTAEHAQLAVHDLGKRFLIDDVVYKERPVCIFVQTPVHLALALKQQHGFDAARIERVSIRAPLATLTNPGYTNVAPHQTPLKARISARFTVAAALLGRPVDEYSYYENTSDPDVLALSDRIDLLDPAADQDGRVDVEVSCGGTAYRLSGLEMDSLTPSMEKITRKFRRLTAGMPGNRSEQLLQAVLHLEEVRDICDLTTLLRAG
jgi:2-methylcitrate dehydratase PrpD